MNFDYFTRSECCAFRTLFQILSGPLPEVLSPRYADVSRERSELWHLLNEILQMPRRSLIELKPVFQKVRNTEDIGIKTRRASFFLKLETKTGRVDIPPADPPELEISIVMHMVMDLPEWSVHRIQVGSVSQEAAILLGGNVHQFAIFAEPV